jgi:hypothetical protein
MAETLLVLAVCGVALVLIWPAARIAARLGFSPWLGVLVVVPLVNVLLLWFVAYSKWPHPDAKPPVT